MNDKNIPYSMSDIIATMAINGATRDELERAIKYSAAVIDAERARKELGIDELEKKYMTVDSSKSRCRNCACLVEGTNGSWVCDELEKDIHNIRDEDCPETSDSPIEYEPKTYEEETDIMECFFDKYESLIQAAPQNSLLGMIRDIDDAMTGIAGHQVDVDHLSKGSENDENLKTAKACITHVAVLLAQMWADENDDIELTCVDPATGEEMSVTVPPFDSETQFVVNRMKEIGESMVNENKDIELTCADPSTGEEAVVKGTPSPCCGDCTHYHGFCKFHPDVTHQSAVCDRFDDDRRDN